jgi:hypothetical protein
VVARSKTRDEFDMLEGLGTKLLHEEQEYRQNLKAQIRKVGIVQCKQSRV